MYEIVGEGRSRGEERMNRDPTPEQEKVLGIVGDWMREINKKNKQIIREWKKGRTSNDIAKEYGISRTQVIKTINKYQKKELLKAEKAKPSLTRTQLLENYDKFCADSESWARKISLLMSHIEAIRAIAEEKNT